MSSDQIRVGRFSADVTSARQWVNRYTANNAEGFAYPGYDHFATGSAPSELNDGDLLAGTLLNAGLSIEAFYSVQTQRSFLEEHLSHIDVSWDLGDADEEQLGHLGDLFSVLDHSTHRGYEIPKLSKILHRKRPGFLFLWDRNLRSCYLGGTEPKVPVETGRSVEKFSVALARAFAADLTSQAQTWADLRPTGSPTLTDLRILDIVGWGIGAGRLAAQG